MLSIPYYILFPAILAFSAIGVYSINSNAFDLFAVAAFGLLGYVLVKFGCEPARCPRLRARADARGASAARDDHCARRSARLPAAPISAVLLGLAVLALVIVLMPNVARKRGGLPGGVAGARLPPWRCSRVARLAARHRRLMLRGARPRSGSDR